MNFLLNILIHYQHKQADCEMKKIFQILNQLNTPDSFYSTGTIPNIFPDILIQNETGITLPFRSSAVKTVHGYFKDAPYGKGEETVYDEKVRKTLELSPEDFCIQNPLWENEISQILKNIRSDLDLGKKSISANLYKMLLYRKGDFFLSHQDTEKEKGMFGTLIVILPSEYEGGESILEHNGKQITLNFAQKAKYEIQYIAFYADIQHEVKKVTRGARLCLIYNLIAKSKTRSNTITEKNMAATTKDIETLFLKNSFPNKKNILLLEHQYTEHSFALENLKGGDYLKTKILLQAAKNAGYTAYLSLVKYYRVDDTYGGEFDGYDGYDEFDETDSLIDDSLEVDKWFDLDGKKVPIAIAKFELDEIISEKEIDSGKPIKQEYEGYTGNAGCTLERWYNRAGIVFWKNEDFIHIIQDMTASNAFKILKKAVSEQRSRKKIYNFSLQECAYMAKNIFSSMRYLSSFTDAQIKQLPAILLKIDDEAAIQVFFTKVIASSKIFPPDADLIQLLNTRSWNVWQEALEEFYKESSVRDNLDTSVKFLLTLCQKSGKKQESIELCKNLTAIIQNKILKYEDSRIYKEDDEFHFDSFYQYSYSVEHGSYLSDTFFCLHLLKENKKIDTMIQHLCKNPFSFSVDKTLPLLLKTVYKKNKTLFKKMKPLHTHCIKHLKNFSTPLPLPKDWTQDVEIGCRCKFCQDLVLFARDAKKKTYSIIASKNKRKHIHRQINNYDIQVTHVTNHKVKPEVMVITKHRKSYNAIVAKKKKLSQTLKELEKLKV